MQAAKFDREELTIWIQKEGIREACAILRDAGAIVHSIIFAIVTCVDWYPSEPRFEVVYHLFSIAKKSGCD